MADTLDEIICPACGKAMKKVKLEEQGFFVDVCTEGCGGMFFDNREFKKVDEKSESIDEILKATENKTFTPVDESQRRVCPVCGHNMVKNHSSHLKKVEVDECYNCGGMFLDDGELLKIRNEYETEADRAAAFKQYADQQIKFLRTKYYK